MVSETQPQRPEREPSPVKRKRAASPESEAHQTLHQPPAKKTRLASDLSISAPDDSRLLDSIEAKYHVQLHSVISSSKIQNKVTSVLRHLTVTPLSSTKPASAAKPRISILRAKASDAGKLISIAEIAKREINSRRKDDETAGFWYQYIGLGQDVKERPKSMAVVEETIIGEKIEDEHEEEEEGEDDNDDFEYMKTPLERAIEGRPKKQAIAIMSLFLARESIDELKRRYGEQTNPNPVKRRT